jgi:hypothetical protein
MLDRVNVAVVLIDHLGLGAYLLGQEVHVHTLGKP